MVDYLYSDNYGKYDFDTFTVILGAHKDKSLISVTALHEFLHHYLTVNTTFGWLINAAKLELGRVQESEKPLARYLFKILARQCFKVNEMTATYGSLMPYRREDLLQDLPRVYQECFGRMAALASHSFDTTMLRTHFAITIARCAMMIGDHSLDTFKDRLSNGVSQEIVPDSESPDARMDKIERILLSIPSGEVRSKLLEWMPESGYRRYFDCDSEEELLETFDGDFKAYLNGMGYLGSSLMFVVCECLEAALPGISDNYSNYRVIRGAKVTFSAERLRGLEAGIDVFQMLHNRVNQTVAFFDGPGPAITVLRKSSEELAEMGEDSLRKLGVIYKYIGVLDRGNEKVPTVYISDVVHKELPVLKCYELSEDECVALQGYNGWCLTLIEENDFSKLGGIPLGQFVYDSLNKNCFVHISRNPIDFISDVLREGYSIEWTAVKVAFRSGVINLDHTLQMALYLLKDFPQAFFHLSNDSIFDVLMQYCDIAVNDLTKLRFISDSEREKKIRSLLLSNLLDHPILNAFYLFGKVPLVPFISSTIS